MNSGDHISRAVERLTQGRLVAFPTETVYGLGADATRADAVERVYAIKGRPARNPLIVHVSDTTMARRCVSAWTDDAEKLARAFWPGPLSIVLMKAALIPDIVTAGAGTVAVRCPDHKLTLELIAKFGKPLVGPSANPSGGISPTRAEHVRGSFTEEDVLVLDGGACTGGIESTVVDLTDTIPRVLRPGLISAEELGRVLGREVLTPEASVDLDAPLKSPGLLSRHYAPSTRTVLCAAHEIDGVLASEAGAGRRAVVLTHGKRSVGGHDAITMPVDARGYAKLLYEALREADGRGAAVIVVESPVFSGKSADATIWRAILDRLVRASREA